MTRALDWVKVWEEFDLWYENAVKENRCEKCNNSQTEYPEWEDQKKAIRRMVNKRLSKKR